MVITNVDDRRIPILFTHNFAILWYAASSSSSNLKKGLSRILGDNEALSSRSPNIIIKDKSKLSLAGQIIRNAVSNAEE